MFVVREIMHCKPGKAGEIVKRFKDMSRIMKELGFKEFRVMTDTCAEQYWTVVAEQDVDSLEKYLDMSRQTMTDARVQQVMQGYHDVVDSGRREIYKLE